MPDNIIITVKFLPAKVPFACPLQSRPFLFRGRIYAEAERRKGPVFRRKTNEGYPHCRGATVYVDAKRTNIAEAERRANKFALPRRNSICGREANKYRRSRAKGPVFRRKTNEGYPHCRGATVYVDAKRTNIAEALKSPHRTAKPHT